jgi:hypothetical protein
MSVMTADARLRLLDQDAVDDLAQFAARARRLDEHAALWLRATGTLLVAMASPLFSARLGDDTPTLVAVKVLPLARPGTADYVTEAQAIADRTARMRSEDDTLLRPPPVEVHEVWTGIAPPRGGWSPVAVVSESAVREVARAGIAEIAAGAPTGSGELAVHELRGRVWGRPADALGGMTAGLAFALDGFGFLGAPGMDDSAASAGPDAVPTGAVPKHAVPDGTSADGTGTVRLLRSGRWQRAAGRYGDVLARVRAHRAG